MSAGATAFLLACAANRAQSLAICSALGQDQCTKAGAEKRVQLLAIHLPCTGASSVSQGRGRRECNPLPGGSARGPLQGAQARTAGHLPRERLPMFSVDSPSRLQACQISQGPPQIPQWTPQISQRTPQTSFSLTCLADSEHGESPHNRLVNLYATLPGCIHNSHTKQRNSNTLIAPAVTD